MPRSTRRLRSPTIEQAIHVVTSGDDELIQKAAIDRDMGRVVFWVKQWMAIERIQSRSEAFSRLGVCLASAGSANMRAAHYWWAGTPCWGLACI